MRGLVLTPVFDSEIEALEHGPGPTIIPGTDVEAARSAMTTPVQQKLDKRIVELKDYPQADMPVIHRLTPGLYTREWHGNIPAGSKALLVVTKVHKTEHPFVFLKGKCKVWTEGQGVVEIQAGHIGITKPGTRRILLVTEDAVWVTFHPNPTDETDIQKLEDSLVFQTAADALGITDVDESIIKQLSEP